MISVHTYIPHSELYLLQKKGIELTWSTDQAHKAPLYQPIIFLLTKMTCLGPKTRSLKLKQWKLTIFLLLNKSQSKTPATKFSIPTAQDIYIYINHIHQLSQTKHQASICQYPNTVKIAIPNSHHKHSSVSLKPPKPDFAKIERMPDLYRNDIGIKSGYEFSEVRPVVLHPKKKAIGIPS